MSLYTVEAGDRIELVSTTDEYTDLEPGDEGTVQGYSEVRMGPDVADAHRKVLIEWDSGSSLALIAGEDKARKLESATDE